MRAREVGFALFATLGLIIGAHGAEPLEETPRSFDGASTYEFKNTSSGPLLLHVVQPAVTGGKAGRPALISFFGGGWYRGTPKSSMFEARWAARNGMVGIAPDYRTRSRHGTTPLESVSDARAALRWVQIHAERLGVNPDWIVVSGYSAGAHLAFWTSIDAAPPGSSPEESPMKPPAAIIAIAPVSDTHPDTGFGAQRLGEHAEALSVPDHLIQPVPPTLIFHGEADQIVPFEHSLRLRDRIAALGGRWQFVPVPGGTHSFTKDLPEWEEKVKSGSLDFLSGLGMPIEVRPPVAGSDKSGLP